MINFCIGMLAATFAILGASVLVSNYYLAVLLMIISGSSIVFLVVKADKYDDFKRRNRKV